MIASIQALILGSRNFSTAQTAMAIISRLPQILSILFILLFLRFWIIVVGFFWSIMLDLLNPGEVHHGNDQEQYSKDSYGGF